MGKKGKWFSNVKKAFSPDSKKFKHKLPQNHSGVISDLVKTSSPPPEVEVEVEEVIVEQSKDVCSPAADAAAEIPEVSSRPVSEVVHCAAPAAAITIQTAFRGYLARRALRALRGLVRLESLLEGPVMKRQAVNTLTCMQTLSRVQSQIRARRIRMSEANQARQKQLLLKHGKAFANSRDVDDWNDSTQSKQQVEANLLGKYEAAMRRERALAYAYSHQHNTGKKKNSVRYANPMSFMDPSNPSWGWSWLERWMAGRPWENPEKEDNEENSRPILSRKSKTRHPSGQDHDAKSTVSVQSEKNPGHRIGGSSIRQDESHACSPSTPLPSYMVPTESARAKLKPVSPLVTDEDGVAAANKAAAKKRLSYSGSSPSELSVPRRYSAPPTADIAGS